VLDVSLNRSLSSWHNK